MQVRALTLLLSSAVSHQPLFPLGVAGPGRDKAAGVTGHSIVFPQLFFLQLLDYVLETWSLFTPSSSVPWRGCLLLAALPSALG